ncbi:MAG TPA: hypothetical protein PLU50_11660, partial [Pseudobdellovibrionaceae bacterium]|nr:hypothetical protein [Pseudobdellovibrionaceae bacterium]
LKSQDLDKDLVRDLMKFKQAVFGGSSQSVSSEEISKGGNLLEKMKSYSIEARLLIPILWLDEKQAYPIQDIDTLQSIMKRFWKDMVVETQLPRSDYTFDDLNSMVDHLGIFMRGREGFASVRKAQSWMPTIKVVKSLLIGKQARIYEKADWIRAGESILSAFTFFMKYKYHWGKKELSNPKDLTDLMIGGNELLSVIEGAFSVYHTGMMFSDIDQLEEILLEKKLSNPFGKDQEGKDLFRGFVRLLVARSLEPIPHSDGNSLDMLTAQNVKILRRIYLRWQLGQVWIQNQFQDASELRILKIKESMNETSYLQTLTSMRSMGLVLNAEDLVQLRSSWLEFQTLFQTEKPIHFDTRGGVILNAQVKTGQ